MPTHDFTPNCPNSDCDFVGNNASFKCRVCARVFLVSAHEHGQPPNGVKGFDGVRQCPGCGNSTAEVHTGQTMQGNTQVFPRFARLTW